MIRRLVSGTLRVCSGQSRGPLRIPTGRVLISTTSHRNSDSHLVTRLVPKLDDGSLSVQWDNGKTNRYPFVYLRDICQCPECFHDSSKQRMFDSVEGLSTNLVTSDVNIQLDGKQITLTWPDNHVTKFSSDWLFERRLPEAVEQQANTEGETIQLWDHQITVPTLDFNEVIDSKSAQIRWLDMIHSYGITLIKNAPEEPGQVHKLGETLGFLKEMWFGESQQITNNLDENERHGTMSPQSSSPYNEYRGGLQLIHCQKEAEGPGGEHTFVDGFKIAQYLQDNDPEAFHLLCTFPIVYQRKAVSKDVAYDMSFARPIIRLDSTGHLTSMVYNDINRVTFSHATPDEIPKLYRAYYKLTDLIRDQKYTVNHKLVVGEIISYDCDRILAGRNAFGPEVKGTEVFESAFSDKDMTLSRRRTLPASLNTELD